MHKKIRSDVKYTHTNESLKAIIGGLAVNENDTVLSVGGSGDAPFALLEFAKEIRVVDRNELQTEYIRARADALKRGDYGAFLEVGEFGVEDGVVFGSQILEIAEFNLKKRNEYLLKPKRLDTIREKLSGLNLSASENIINVAAREKGFTKIYLSNISPGAYTLSFNMDVPKILELIAEQLPLGGLIYITNNGALVRTYVEGGGRKIPSELMLNEALSMLARKQEDELWREQNEIINYPSKESMWAPGVYEVVRHNFERI